MANSRTWWQALTVALCAGAGPACDRAILDALKKKRLVADWMCTVNFAEGSRRPRDSRPLFRLCALVVADQKKSDFKNSHLVKDGCVNNCSLLPVEARHWLQHDRQHCVTLLAY